MNQRKVIIDTDKCIGCGLCSKVCVAHNLTVNHKKAEILLDDCVMCGQCSAVCPQRAISMVGCGSGQMERSADIRLDPDDILNTIRFRRSVRSFKETEIPREVIEQILEANGLGVLYSGFFTMAANGSRKIKKEIGVSKGKKVAMTLVLGYPSVKFLRSTPHKELEVRYM